MRTSRFLHSAHEHGGNWLVKKVDHLMGALARVYHRALVVCLNHRIKLVALSFALFALSASLVTFLNQELVPSQDQSLFLLNLQTPVGTSIAETDRTFAKAEAYLKARKDVEDLYTTIGNYNGNDIVNSGNIYVTLAPLNKRSQGQHAIMDDVRSSLEKQLPGVLVFIQDLSLTGFSASRGFPVEFTIVGPNWDQVVAHSKTLMDAMKKTGLFTDINTDYQDGMPEIQVIPDRDRAAAHGLTVSAIGNEVSTLIGGMKFSANTQFPAQGHRYDIRVRSEADQHDSPEDLDKIMLWSNRGSEGGEMIHLPEAARIVQGKAPQIITRMNRSRAVPVYANVTYGKSQRAALDKVEELALQILPADAGYRVLMTGSAQGFKDTFDSLFFALLLGIAVAYMILASQFNSFVHPLTVLIALPFSLTGALGALFVTHQSINLFSMIGLILLMGIVKKNSILLVDFTNQRRTEGLDPTAALLEACPVRLRPILMTSIACIAGAIPAAISMGPGSETRVPMAISIIGGVAISTFLTLFVVPCFYSLMVYFERPDTLEAEPPNHNEGTTEAPAHG